MYRGNVLPCIVMRYWKLHVLIGRNNSLQLLIHNCVYYKIFKNVPPDMMTLLIVIVLSVFTLE